MGKITTSVRVLSFIVFVSSIVYGIGFMGYKMIEWHYPYSQNVDAYFDRAKTTNDLDQVANYLEIAYDYLSDFEGNPDWIFPTDKTNWTLILSDFWALINTTRIAANTTSPGEDAYEEALNTIDEKIDLIANQTRDNYDLELTKEYFGGGFAIILTIIISFFCIFIGFYDDW